MEKLSEGKTNILFAIHEMKKISFLGLGVIGLEELEIDGYINTDTNGFCVLTTKGLAYICELIEAKKRNNEDGKYKF